MNVEFHCLVLHLRNTIRSAQQCLRFNKNEDVEVFEVLKLQSQTLRSSSERLVTVTAAWMARFAPWTHENTSPSQTWSSALTNLTVSGSHGWHGVAKSGVATPIAACNQIWFQHHFHSDYMNRNFDFAHACLGFSTSYHGQQRLANYTFQASHLWCCPCRHLSTCRDISAKTSESLESQPAFWKLSPPHSFALWSFDRQYFRYRFQGLWLHKCQHQNHLKSQTQWAKTGCLLHPVYHEFAVTMLAVLQRSVKSGQGTSFVPSLPAEQQDFS